MATRSPITPTYPLYPQIPGRPPATFSGFDAVARFLVRLTGIAEEADKSRANQGDCTRLVRRCQQIVRIVQSATPQSAPSAEVMAVFYERLSNIEETMQELLIGFHRSGLRNMMNAQRHTNMIRQMEGEFTNLLLDTMFYFCSRNTQLLENAAVAPDNQQAGLEQTFTQVETSLQQLVDFALKDDTAAVAATEMGDKVQTLMGRRHSQTAEIYLRRWYDYLKPPSSPIAMTSRTESLHSPTRRPARLIRDTSGKIESGSVEQLVENMLSGNGIDDMSMSAFFLLRDASAVPTPRLMETIDQWYVRLASQSQGDQHVLKVRFLRCLAKWVDQMPEEYGDVRVARHDKVLLKNMDDFLAVKLGFDDDKEDLLAKIHTQLNKAESFYRAHSHSPDNSMAGSSSLATSLLISDHSPNSNSKKAGSRRDRKPPEVAEQLTVYASAQFKGLHRRDLALYLQHEEDMSSFCLRKLLRIEDSIERWTKRQVLQHTAKEVDRRADVYKQFYLIAKECLDMNNYMASAAIVRALRSPEVENLEKTMALVKQHGFLKSKSDLEKCKDIEGHFTDTEYEKLLQQRLKRKESCVPILGPYLRSLRATYSQLVDQQHLTDVFNLKLASVLSQKLDAIILASRSPISGTIDSDTLNVCLDALEKASRISDAELEKRAEEYAEAEER